MPTVKYLDALDLGEARGRRAIPGRGRESVDWMTMNRPERLNALDNILINTLSL